MTVTTNHKVIKMWADKFQGKPEVLPNTENETGAIGIRIDFPGKLDDTYITGDNKRKHVSWEQFFRMFEEQNLALEFEDKEKIEDPGSAYRFIRRENIAVE